jgi:hypothetical protein
METALMSQKPKKQKDKGYHIRNFDAEARRLAKAGATLTATDIGAWISQAVKEKFARDITPADQPSLRPESEVQL